jgi:hypothetical protein
MAMTTEFKLGDRVRVLSNGLDIPVGSVGTVVSSHIRPSPKGFKYVDVLMDDESERSKGVLDDGTPDQRWPFARTEIEVIHE